MNQGLLTAAYILASVLFVLALGGLSNPETARRGNWFGMIGMAIALIATIAGPQVTSHGVLLTCMLVGGMVGVFVAARVQMTAMPELVAILHSFVGLAAVLVGYANFLDPAIHLQGVAQTIHRVETYLGVLIGGVTFTGSVVAFGKLNEKITSKPLYLPGRHWLNLGLALACVWLGILFAGAEETSGIWPLLLMTLIALVFGVHLVMAIGGADMPVVISMLNSYSGWAAAATGFMLSNDLLIVTGALVGSSGAILSYIMCRAMNRKFLAVIAGGFGGDRSGRRGRGGSGGSGSYFGPGNRGIAQRRQGSGYRSRLRAGGSSSPAPGVGDHP
jgi:NAD(P) transhydrogenase subunit beta